MHTQMGADEGADQPAPHRALVVGRVARAAVAAVAADVLRIVGRQAAQAMRGQQAPGADVHHGARLCLVQRAVRQRDGEELVRPQARIVAGGAVKHVVAVAPLGVPKALKALPRLLGHGVIGVGIRGMAQTAGEAGQAARALYHSALISTGLPMRGVTTQSSSLASIQVSCTSADPP